MKMIRIKTGSELHEFYGTIDVTPEIEHMVEEECVYNPGLSYRFGKYFIDKIQLNLSISAEDYENLYYKVMQAAEWIIAWETLTGYQWRKSRSPLPYPSKIRFINDAVTLKIESEPYINPINNMTNITLNTIWNESTPDNTIWN